MDIISGFLTLPNGERLVELRKVRQNGQPIWNWKFDHVFWLQQGRNPQVLFCDRERQLVVVVDVVFVEF